MNCPWPYWEPACLGPSLAKAHFGVQHHGNPQSSQGASPASTYPAAVPAASVAATALPTGPHRGAAGAENLWRGKVASLEVPLCPGQPVGEGRSQAAMARSTPHSPTSVTSWPRGQSSAPGSKSRRSRVEGWGEPAGPAKPFLLREGAGGKSHALLGSACKKSRWGRGLPRPKTPLPTLAIQEVFCLQTCGGLTPPETIRLELFAHLWTLLDSLLSSSSKRAILCPSSCARRPQREAALRQGQLLRVQQVPWKKHLPHLGHSPSAPRR